MEKEIDRSKNVGSVKIADDVVAMIAGIAAKEVDGVYGLTGNATSELMSKVGMKSQNKGVRVDVLEKVVTVDLSIVMEYGYNIPITCGKIQDRVKSAIENMTHLEVADVNVKISGVAAPRQ